MVAAEQEALRKKDQSSVLWETVAQNLKVKKEEFSSNQNFFIVEKYIVAYSIVDVVKYLEFIEYKRIPSYLKFWASFQRISNYNNLQISISLKEVAFL